MEFTLAELATVAGGTVRGDPAVRIQGACGIEDAGPGEITFLAHPKYAALVERTRAGAIVVSDRMPAPRIPST